MWEVAAVVTLFGLAAGVALAMGSAPEKTGAVIIVVWLGSNLFYYQLAGQARFDVVEPIPAALDLLAFGALVTLALRANRLWPIGAAAVQTIPLMGHLIVAAGYPGMQRAYWTMTQLPPVLIAALLVAGTVAHRRRFRRIGKYPDWRRAKV